MLFRSEGNERNEVWLEEVFGLVEEWECEEEALFRLVEVRMEQSDLRAEYRMWVQVLNGEGQPAVGESVVVAGPTRGFYDELVTDGEGKAWFDLGERRWRYAVPGEGPLQAAVKGEQSDGVLGLGRVMVDDGPDRWLCPTFRWSVAPPPPPVPGWKVQALGKLEALRVVLDAALDCEIDIREILEEV